MFHQFSSLKKACLTEWRNYIEHSFVRQLGDATLACTRYVLDTGRSVILPDPLYC